MARLRALLTSRSLAIVLLLVSIHMLVFDRGLGGDGWAGFATLESLADDGDPWVEDDHRGVMNGLVGGISGHLVMQYPPGVLALDALPFFLGRGLDRALPAGLLADGIDLPPVGRVPRGVFLATAMIVLARNAATLLGLLWIVLALRRLGVPEPTAAAAAALTFFGGPMIFYSLVGMTHAPAFALAGLLLLVLVRQRQEGSVALAFAAGAVVGAAVLLRYGSAALLAPALLAVSGRSPWRARLACVAGFLLPLAVLPFWWRATSGGWGFPSYGGAWELSAANPWNVLFSPVHGLFLFHPALLLAAAALGAATWREAARREIGWGMIGWGTIGWGTIGCVWFLAVALLHGGWSEWANTGGYGQRFLIDALPAFSVGFARFLEGGRKALRRAALGAAALGGYLLFFAAVGRLVPPPPPYPWPQTLGDYSSLLDSPPTPAALAQGLREASFLVDRISR
jgi:hypothetical protein